MKREMRVEKRRDIRIGKTRILTPYEAQSMERVIKNRQVRALYRYLLATGIRFNEFPYIIETPENYDIAGRVIHLKALKRWDVARFKRDRDVYLSYADVMDVNSFLRAWYTKRRRRMLYTERDNQGLTRYIRYWVASRGHDPRGYGTITLRKTRFLWLAVTFPEKLDIITRSLDYDPFYNAEDASKVEAYIDNPPFTRGELKKIEKILYGWKGSEL